MRKIFVTTPLPTPTLIRLAERAHVVVHARGAPAASPSTFGTIDVEPPTRAELIRGAAGCFGVLTSLRDVIDGAVLDATGVRVVANCAVGYDNIDLDAATKRRVWVTHTPHVLTEATADLAFALILAVTRRVVAADRLVRAGGFSGWSASSMLGTELRGRTLGILGMGRIGRAVARRGVAFGMRVVHHGGRAEHVRSEERGLDSMLRECEVLSIHAPLSQRTRHLIGERELGLMRPGAFLINTARAAIVDEEALVAALATGHLGGAGLDVHPVGPGGERPDPRLFAFEQVVLTPHIGSATHETRRAMAERAVDNLLAALAGERPPDCLT